MPRRGTKRKVKEEREASPEKLGESTSHVGTEEKVKQEPEKQDPDTSQHPDTSKDPGTSLRPAQGDEGRGDPKQEDVDEKPGTSGRDLSTCPPIRINRAPVLVLWVAVVAERQGFSFGEGLSFGQAISGMFAHSKGRSLGIYEDKSEEHKEKKRKKEEREVEEVEVFGRHLKAIRDSKGQLQAESDGKPVSSKAARAYVSKAFGSELEAAADAMRQLAQRVPKEEIGHRAYHLYEVFRPNVPTGVRGWGAKGELNLSGVVNAVQFA